MRRTVLLLATMALTPLVASGVALAVTKIGTDGTDTLRGTNGADTLIGKGGNDVLFALAGDDTLLGGLGPDTMVGGDGNDFVLGAPGPDKISGGDGNDVIDVLAIAKDVVTCGGGLDRVLADRAVVVAPDCERVFVGERSVDAYFESIPESFFEGLNPRF